MSSFFNKFTPPLNRSVLHQQTATVKQLAKHGDFFDVIDELRSVNVNSEISHPVIIVVGDQSSGKSSTLNGISNANFSMKSTACTRFPIELVLRYNKDAKPIDACILPGPNATLDEKKKYAEYTPDWTNVDDLETIIDAAKGVMGIGNGLDQKSFSTDILRVEIRGPWQPDLTLVDLPGITQLDPDSPSSDDSDLIRELVRSYMARPRSIILAVVSAQNDIQNQEVIKLAHEYDPDGERTLGVITKPDTLEKASDMEQEFFKLANNEKISLRLGWHVLRNRNFKTRACSIEERNKREEKFFQKGIWTSLDPKMLGVTHLMERLGSVLRDHILSHLPGLTAEITRELQDCERRKRALGKPRKEIDGQRFYLLSLSREFSDLLSASMYGETYHNEFFGDAELDSGYHKRLRAVIQQQMLDFAEIMKKRGHEKEIIDDEASLDLSEDRKGPPQILRNDYLAEVQRLLKRSRGPELAGTCNPLIISDLFLKQARPWKKLAEEQSDVVLTNVRRTLVKIVTYIADESTRKGLLKEIIYPGVEKLAADFKEKISELLEPHMVGYHAITYNPSFLENMLDITNKRDERLLRKKFSAFVDVNPKRDSFFPITSTNLPDLLKVIRADDVSDMDLKACGDHTDLMQAYYQIAMRRFIDDFATLGVERILLKRLKDIYTPEVVYCLDSSIVASIAAESAKSLRERKDVEAKEVSLRTGLNSLRELYLEKETDDFQSPAGSRKHLDKERPQKDGSLRTEGSMETGGRESGTSQSSRDGEIISGTGSIAEEPIEIPPVANEGQGYF